MKTILRLAYFALIYGLLAITAPANHDAHLGANGEEKFGVAKRTTYATPLPCTTTHATTERNRSTN